MRRKLMLILGVGCCLLGLTFTGVSAQEASKLTTNLDLSYVGKYVWRGIPQTEDGAFQPSLTFSHNSGLSLNLWASYDDNASQVKEHDYTLNYAWSTKGLGLNAGYIYYAFPNTLYASTSEVYSSVALPGKFSPVISLNYDVDEANGFYLALSGGYSLPTTLKKASSVNLSGRIGFGSSDYNGFWFGTDKSALTDLYLCACMPFETSAGKVTPSISYTKIINSDLEDALSAAGLDTDSLYAGVTLSHAL